MTSPDRPASSFEPRLPTITAVAIFAVAALVIFWPMLTGSVLLGDDQISAGYVFRELAAQGMRTTGHIPLWNPYIFGGMPLWAVPGHFDVFYPSAWLRWFMHADMALTLGYYIHFVVAGLAMFTLLRTLRSGWTGALVGGLAYEFSGILASQVSPGHDGKLYAAALSPFAFVALIRAIRHGRISYYGWFALVIGLVMLTPHYLAAYYLLIASALFTLWLVFLDPERRRDWSPLIPMALAAAGVAVGLGVAALELLPVQHAVAYTARGEGGVSLGYDYATSYAMPPIESMTTILPQFNGVLQHYWGSNFFKNHTEYLGAIVVTLMIFGFPAARRRRLLLPFAGLGALFLLVAWGGHTPFYHLWYLLPKMGQFRAPGLAFFMVALCACLFAGLGTDELLMGRTGRTLLLSTVGVLGGIGLLAAAGALQGITLSLAGPTIDIAAANASELQAGGLRLLVVMIVGGGVVWSIQRGLARGVIAAAALCVLVVGDNWSIVRNFTNWLPRASVLFADDELTLAMKKSPMPFRVYDPSSPDGARMGIQQLAQLSALSVYPSASLMARGIPTVFGYHGMESRYFDVLFGTKNVWTSQLSRSLWDLYAVRYVTLAQAESLPGFHRVLGPVQVGGIITPPHAGILFERDSAIQWVRMIPAGAKVADSQIPPTVADPRFPYNSYVLFADTASVKARAPGPTPAPSAVTASLTSWVPGAMTVKLTGADTRTTYLVVAENWYPDWHAKIDGVVAPTHRGDGALLTVEVPPGAKEVSLWYDIASYRTGKMVTLLSLVLVVAVIVTDRMRRRTVDA